ncbi:branched-chain amino acid ABC transporter permease [uncultured Demequina sp.]|mgnify:FL=1|uniref:branched-chain amino acid ABC transporter permease n=1 Tax=uncultured Demequina sp. TaxID=693499 RepID=UPI0025CC3739|nr:branched-chain amino acid ABC transporter permease [uncultured Demequina sp.]
MTATDNSAPASAGRGWSSELRRRAPLLAGVGFVVLLACLPLLNISIPGILPTPTYQPGAMALMSLAMVFAALALSYNMLLGTSGMLSFGHALYFGAGAYGLGIALEHLGVPLWPGVLIALLGGLVIALITGSVAMRVNGIPFAMVTLAFAQAGSVLVRRNASVTGGEEGLSLNTEGVPDALVGVINTRNLYWACLVMVVVVYLVALWVDRSRLGHLASATRENELRVRVLGLKPNRARLTLFVIAGLCAGLAGMAYMLLQSGTVPRAVSADLTITVLVMVVLGGVGYRWGAVLGGVVYTILDQRLTVLAGSDAIDALPSVLRIPLSEPLFILGTLFILMVLFAPGGIAGTVHAWIDRRRHRNARDEGLRELDADASANDEPVEVRA